MAPTPSRKRMKPTEASAGTTTEKWEDQNEHVQVLVTLEYHGTAYGGWQRQGPNNHIKYPSVQGTLEAAATAACNSFAAEYDAKRKIDVDADTDITTTIPASRSSILIPTTESGDWCAVMSGTSGRTDRGVHALDHHCLLRLPFSKTLLQSSSSELSNFLIGTSVLPPLSQNDPSLVPAVATSPFLTVLNNVLPSDVHVLTCRSLTKQQRKNLRFSRKRYRYILQQGPTSASGGLNRPWPSWNGYTYFVKERLDVDRIREALQHLIGTHDFLPLSCQKDKVNTVRTLYDANITVLEPLSFGTIPWFAQAYRQNNTTPTMKRKDKNNKDDTIENNNQNTESNSRDGPTRQTGSVFLPPHYGADPKQFSSPHSRKNHPRPEDCKLFCIEFEGNGFLRHQVRRMVSVLQKIGEGVWEPDYILTILEGGDTKPLKGLALSPGRALWKAKVWMGDNDRGDNTRIRSDNNEDISNNGIAAGDDA